MSAPSEAQTAAPGEILWAPVTVECPHGCGPVAVQAVQGDRCPACLLEFTRFEPGQDLVASDFYDVLTGEKFLCELSDGGWIVAHK